MIALSKSRSRRLGSRRQATETSETDSMRNSWKLAPAIALACCLAGSQVLAAPAAELWPRWQKHDAASTRTIDHSAWQSFLKKYLVVAHPSGVNRLRYGGVSAEDKASLDGYVARLEKVSISTYGRNAQQAYWINLYNALTIKVVLEHFPVESIKDISLSSGLFGGLFGGGPWKAKLVTVEGEKVSLDDIEHRILRPIWRDNRVHYAVNCASIGCPNLQAEVFTADNTERLLDAGAREYVNHPRGAAFENGRLRVSSIYDWFQADFGGNAKGVVEHLGKYAEPPLRKRLEEHSGGFDHHYDWNLNAER